MAVECCCRVLRPHLSRVVINRKDHVEDLVVIDIPERVRQPEYRRRADHDADDRAAQAFDAAASAKFFLQGENIQGAGPISMSTPTGPPTDSRQGLNDVHDVVTVA